MKKIIFILLFLPLIAVSQNKEYAKEVINNLASSEFKGRGYAHEGDKTAAKYIAGELEKMHIKKKGKDYFQPFKINTNIFPSRMIFTLDGEELKPGVDFIVHPTSGTVKGKYSTVLLDKEILNNEKKYTKFKTKDHIDEFVIIDTVGMKNEEFKEDYNEIIDENTLKAAGLITVQDNLMSFGARYQNDFAHVILKRDALPEKTKEAYFIIDAQDLFGYETQNVFGFIEGQVDTFIVLTAHYDHLGTMGSQVFFPGANDNASGCALLLDMAKEYSQRKSKPHYGLAFIFFSAEEIGLVGSHYFTENPLIDLKKIKFLINFDMVGTGEEGIRIVNSTVYKSEYEKLLKINEKYSLLKEVKKRGPAANSDHYYFYEKGVPSYFVYSLGAYKEYHNIYDTREKVPLNAYESIFKLFMFFIDELYDDAMKK